MLAQIEMKFQSVGQVITSIGHRIGKLEISDIAVLRTSFTEQIVIVPTSMLWRD